MASVDFVTATEVKNAMEITGTGRDTAIGVLITQASRAINARYQREFTPQTTSTARTFKVRNRYVDLAPYDLRAATVVSLNSQLASPTTLTSGTDYTLGLAHPVTATYQSLRLAASVSLASTFFSEFGFTVVSVTGTWGAWATADVVEDVKRACIVTVAAWMDKAISEYGVDSLAEGRTQLPGGPGTWAIPPAAHSLITGAGLNRLQNVA